MELDQMNKFPITKFQNSICHSCSRIAGRNQQEYNMKTRCITKLCRYYSTYTTFKSFRRSPFDWKFSNVCRIITLATCQAKVGYFCNTIFWDKYVSEECENGLHEKCCWLLSLHDVRNHVWNRPLTLLPNHDEQLSFLRDIPCQRMYH